MRWLGVIGYCSLALAGVDFGDGKALEGWTLVGNGRIIDGRALAVVGKGEEMSVWRHPAQFTPGQLYRFRMLVQRDGSGSVIAGPEFANRDYTIPSGPAVWEGHVFWTPPVAEPFVRIGHWRANGEIRFDAVRCEPVAAVHRSAGKIELGEGEWIRAGRYEFRPQFDWEGSNYHRTLESATARFNSNRWCFGSRDEATYRFAVPGHRTTAADFDFQIGYYLRGQCVAEASRDGEQWRPIAVLDKSGSAAGPIPADLLPADVLFIRLRGDGKTSNFQVPELGFRATLDGQPADMIGATAFAELENGRPKLVKFEPPKKDFYREAYGERLAVASDSATVWWCPAMHKVPRQRAAPTAAGLAAKMACAKHDYEAVQVVVRSGEKGLRGLTASMGPLVGPGSATIPPDRVRLLRVHYHFVEHPTDRTGVRDYWPDALPPLAKPIDVAPNQNQPIWLSVYVPAEAAAGDYEGRLSLKADGFSADVPVRLHVWNFTLPKQTHLESGYGMNPSLIFRYHNLKTDADKRRVLDLYFQSYAEHRICPYRPAPLDPIRVKFLSDAKPPRAELDFAAFDAGMSRAFEKWGFSRFMLPIEAMGGGTFQSRSDPKIGKFGEDTPEYRAMFSSYAKQLESHLREKGWLEKAYVYWFDEPDPKDYEFVRHGNERLHREAPGITRMLTEEPGDALAGAVDLWCPVSFNYDHAAAENRRAAGDRFWWYVCCGPKAPYCTLFIDHAATELRVWHWQTWQRKINGTLVWETNYWTSETAWPDSPQNPYNDPMGYVGDHTLPKGTKRYWGNGDGRFLYPPESAAVPGMAGGQPILEPPVTSIRWEMIREGVEDFEFLYRLRELIEARRGKLPADRLKELESLLEVPPEITTDATHFTTDPKPIFDRRAKIAAAIEDLEKK